MTDQLEARNAVLGNVIAHLVRSEFDEGPAGESGAPGVRLMGFDKLHEIERIVAAFMSEPARAKNSTEPARIVVGSRDVRGAVPHDLFLQPGWTLTRHRNENDHGLVIIDLDPQSDQNGLRAMHTITDGDVLSVSGDLANVRLRLIAEATWREVVGSPFQSDELLLAIGEIFKSVTEARPLALRAWVSYMVAVATEIDARGPSIDSADMKEIAANELPHLNLFPDRSLFLRAAFVSKRLVQNAHMSELRNPQGKPLADDQIESLIEDVILVDAEGVTLSSDATAEARLRMRTVLDAGGPAWNSAVEFSTWEQLFGKKRAVTGLGGQVHDFFEQELHERLEEYKDLKVQDGLDDGDPDAALDLIQAEPPSGIEPRLIDCLGNSIRKRIERLAFQNERLVTDPLIAVLYGLNGRDTNNEAPEGAVATLEIEAASETAERSIAVFAFLYGQTLAEIADTCDGAVGVRFELDDRIATPGGLLDVFHGFEANQDDDDSEDDFVRTWEPLRFRLRYSDSSTPLLRFRWDPREVAGLVTFAHLVSGAHRTGRIEIPDIKQWAETLMAPGALRSGQDDAESSDELVRAWRALTERSFAEWTSSGLSASGISDFLDEWWPILDEAVARHVPKGAALPALDEFLEQDTARSESGTYVMLASHPLRLRWLQHHLQHLTDLITRSLFGDLSLNPENDRVFFDWIGKVSPHRQPAAICPSAGSVATAVQEWDLHEEYGVTASGAGGDASVRSGAIDFASIDELVAATRSFLQAFPHKLEGLSVMLLAVSGAPAMARRFVEQLRQRELANLDLELHVVTAASDHAAIAEELATLDTDEGRGLRLLPTFRLLVHPWDGDVPACLSSLTGRVDIALAPNLFGLHTTVLEETKRNNPNVGGRFDPWIDPTIHVRPGTELAINVSQVLLPENPDPALQNWSTLTVRRRRQTPVAAEEPQSIDFLTLRVAFDKNERLFELLHEVANWVVTLDPFVGRDQIDNLKNAPDVIVVRSNVGKNETYTLVISSTAGRGWVERQLAHRLTDNFDLPATRAKALSTRLYELGRHVAPGLMLRALGLGRATEEILGLVLARYATEHTDLSAVSDGTVDYWISLDDHTDWFGGPQRMRPDLLRVRIAPAEEAPAKLEVLALESKFRQQFDYGAAEEQTKTGVRLFSAAFAAGPSAPSDAQFWRRELLTAIRELSQQTAPNSDLPPIVVHGKKPDADPLAALHDGTYDFLGAQGQICLTGWNADGAVEPEHLTTSDGLEIIRLSREAALEILQRIESGLEPSRTITARVGPRPTVDEPSASSAASGGEPATPPAEPKLSSDEQGLDQTGADRLSDLVLAARLGRIVDRLRQLGIEVDQPPTDGWKEGPGFCVYRVVPRSGVSADRVTGKLDDLKLALELPAELNIRSYVDKGTVVFEVPKDDDDRYYISAHELWQRTPSEDDALSIPLGEDISGDTVMLDFSSSDTPHLLIAGQTGSGKSIALEAILMGLCGRKTPAELQLLLVDPKSTELMDLENDPHVRGDIGWTPEDALQMLSDGIEEMDRRYQSFRSVRARSLPEFNGKVPPAERLPWWLIVLDEYADLTSDPDDRKAIEVDLKRIAQKGRAAGIHLVVATQKPSAEVISTVIRSNLPAQLALRVRSAIDSRIIIEEAGAESLAGKGDAFLRTAKGLQRLQCAKVE